MDGNEQQKILISWIGFTDLRTQKEPEKVGLGPIGQAVTERSYSGLVLVSDLPREQGLDYVRWLKSKTTVGAILYETQLSSPTCFGEIYEAAVDVVERTLRRSPDADLTFHLSPRTPAMAAVWIILAKTRYPAELIESSMAHGVKTASVPFDISAEFIPDLLRKPDNLIEEIRENRFRADLFYRLAVAVLHIPPLRDRKGVFSILIDRLLDKVNQESEEEPGYTHKKISAGARNLLINHDWPGNVRELLNMIRRSALCS